MRTQYNVYNNCFGEQAITGHKKRSSREKKNAHTIHIYMNREQNTPSNNKKDRHEQERTTEYKKKLYN